ncbi:MAG: hypothetical protein ACI4XM_02175 [Candidatus Coprovivens sp.]
METNEQGLTKEEKIMFGILGVILIIAIGVLFINSFSANERQKEDETPITENKGQDKVEDETNANKQEPSLIEDETLEVISKKPSPKPTQTIVKKPIKEETTKTEIPGIIEWSFKDNMITEAYSNETIIIDKNVILKDGTEKEAVVTIRKLIDNSWNIIDISTNEITVTEGLYKYYYTYGNQTKELLLTVKNKLELDKIEFLTIKENYEEDYSITEEEYNKYQYTLLNSKILDNTYIIETIKNDKTSNIIPIVLTVTEELISPTITTSTLGIIPTIENNNWYQELNNKEIILWIDLDIIDLTNPEINININGTDYYFNLYIVVNTSSEESTNKEENEDEKIDEEEIEEKIKDDQSEEKEQPSQDEENIIDDNTIEENSLIENNQNTNENIESLEPLNDITISRINIG